MNIVRDGALAYIMRDGPLLSREGTVVLETNVVIDLERFYFCPKRMKPDRRSAIANMLIQFQDADMIPGFGMQEACWNSSAGELDSDRCKKLEHALNHLWSMSPDDIRCQLSKKDCLSKNRPSPNKKDMRESSYVSQVLKANPDLLTSYAAILKIHHLKYQKQHHKKQDRNLIGEYAKFMIEELRSINALEWFLAVDYFLGKSDRSQYVHKLLHLDSMDLLRTSWKTAWDLFFLRLLLHVDTHSYLDCKNQVILVTSDKGVEGMAEYLDLSGIFIARHDPYILPEYEVAALKNPDDISLVSELEKLLNMSAYGRAVQRLINENKVDNGNDVLRVIKGLEDEVKQLSRRHV